MLRIYKLNFLLFVFSLFSFNTFARVSTEAFVNISSSLGSTDAENAINSSDINSVTITPNFQLDYKKTRLNISANYALIYNNDFTESDASTTHNYGINTKLIHIPNRWNSFLRTNSSQTNNPNSEQLISEHLVNTSNLDTYQSNSLGTNYSYIHPSSLRFNSNLELSSSGYKEESKARGQQATLNINSGKIYHKVNFSYQISSNISEQAGIKQQLDKHTFKRIYNLRYNLSTDLILIDTNSHGDSTNNELNETSINLGINWNPSRNNSLSFSMGQIGDNTTWSASANYKRRRSDINFSHSESVQFSNSINDEISSIEGTEFEEFIASNNSVSFNKTDRFTFTHTMRRSNILFTLLNNRSFSDLDGTQTATNKSASLAITHKLNSKKSLTYSFSNNTVKNNEIKQLLDYSVKWTAQLSRKSLYTLAFTVVDQTSSVLGADYEQNQIDFNYRVSF